LKFKWETEFRKTEIGEIPRDWRVKRIKNFAEVKGGKRLPKGMFLTTIPNDHPYIRIVDITDGRIDTNNILYVPEDIYSQIKNYVVYMNDVIISIVGTIGIAAYVGKQFDGANLTENAAKITNIKDANPKFITYYLNSPIGQQEIESNIVGSTQPKLPLYGVQNIRIPLPSTSEQSRIATVLSWFDDLIENKKRQNEILEKTAMAIFKSWFVDFEPFQDEEFIYNEELDREIPKEWEVKRLGMFAEITMGQSPPSKYYNENGEGLPFIQGKGQYGRFTPETTIYCSRLIKIAKPNDVLVTVRAPVGDLNLADREYIIGRGVASLRSKYWIFLFLYLLTNNERLKSYERGTTYDAITSEELNTFPLLLPLQLILQRFHSLVEPLFQKIILNQKQIMALRKIRDALLPQLVFGKLRVVEL